MAVSNFPELLDEKQAAEFLGLRPQTLATWRCARRYDLPFIKVGRLIRYRRSACEKFLEARTIGEPSTAAAVV